MGTLEKLQMVQTELKAPKNQYNKFANFKYRSCEDILEALKPILAKHQCALTISDEIVQIGDRYYVKATAKFWDTTEDWRPLENSALAREPGEKKGMDEPQVTGTASSYARKYCLNGLFMIDDAKDADTDEYHEQTSNSNAPQESATARIAKLKIEMNKAGINLASILATYGMKEEKDKSLEQNLARLSVEQYEDAMKKFAKQSKKNGSAA